MLETELALRFLEQDLMRNAAGKAWQAWKALLAAAAAQNREAIASRFGGVVKDKTGEARQKSDIIIAYIPTTRAREVASILADIYGVEIVYLTDLAINLHEFQYNGLDPEEVASRYTDIRDVEKDIRHLAQKTKEWAKKIQQPPPGDP